MNILLGVTGSVAAVLTEKLFNSLKEIGEVRVVLTKTAKNFGIYNVPYYEDDAEWDTFGGIGDEILHIELRKWANVFLIAPCTANTIGKIANGLCDNLLTNVAMAWDYSKPFIIAPACNTHMWSNNAMQTNLSMLKFYGIKVVYPIEKTLACGDTGVGAMAKIEDIVERVKNAVPN